MNDKLVWTLICGIIKMEYMDYRCVAIATHYSARINDIIKLSYIESLIKSKDIDI